MHLASSLASTAAVPRPEKFGAFAKHLPHEWIEQALQATGSATVRKRRLPAEQVVWLVLGMALFRDRSIVEIVDKLDLALPGVGEAPIAPSAVPQARAWLSVTDDSLVGDRDLMHSGLLRERRLLNVAAHAH